LSAPANSSAPPPFLSSAIAGSVLPIKRAEELLATLPGVIAARIIASPNGAVDEIHVLTTADVAPKQTVRNIESALIAHLGMRVDHRKISVATTVEAPKTASDGRFFPNEDAASATAAANAANAAAVAAAAAKAAEEAGRRRYYFEDVEVRRSRAKGVTCRVTLRRGEETYIGESEGVESERSRADLAARATLMAIQSAEGGARSLALDGVKLIEAFEREFIFVGVTARWGRETALLTGSCEIRDGAETASSLAVLDATNRWIAHEK
jgi:hypothetical protein